MLTFETRRVRLQLDTAQYGAGEDGNALLHAAAVGDNIDVARTWSRY